MIEYTEGTITVTVTFTLDARWNDAEHAKREITEDFKSGDIPRAVYSYGLHWERALATVNAITLEKGVRHAKLLERLLDGWEAEEDAARRSDYVLEIQDLTDAHPELRSEARAYIPGIKGDNE